MVNYKQKKKSNSQKYTRYLRFLFGLFFQRPSLEFLNFPRAKRDMKLGKDLQGVKIFLNVVQSS